MASRLPLESGLNAWGIAGAPPPFNAERPAPIDPTTRRWPAAIRLLGRRATDAIGRPAESGMWDAVRYLIHPTRRTIVNRLGRDPERDDLTQTVLEWITRRENSKLTSWWKSTWGWRSPREFPNYRKLENHIGVPHIEPYEIAFLRIPDDVSGDLDVLLYVAWCQGVLGRHIEHDEEIAKDHYRSIRKGLMKLHRSPWFAFALAAPHMQPVGVLFKGAGYFDSCERMEFLLRQPYQATDNELARILPSSMFAAGYESAKQARKGGEYMQPPGTWYVNGSRTGSLGVNFRRGGAWTAAHRGTT
jgi:hypothetical protein